MIHASLATGGNSFRDRMQATPETKEAYTLFLSEALDWQNEKTRQLGLESIAGEEGLPWVLDDDTGHPQLPDVAEWCTWDLTKLRLLWRQYCLLVYCAYRLFDASLYSPVLLQANKPACTTRSAVSHGRVSPRTRSSLSAGQKASNSGNRLVLPNRSS